MTQMPVIVAMGINFGIVPLLFIQVGYAKIFYPATVLMAWFWLAIIGVLIPAYYGVYIYAFGLKDGGLKMGLWHRLAGWIAAAMFLWIGFTFANAMSLMENVRVARALGAAQFPWGRLGHGVERRRSASLAALAIDVRPGPDDHGRLGRVRRRLVRPPREPRYRAGRNPSL